MKTDITRTLDDAQCILNGVANILAYMDDVPEGCANLIRLAAEKIGQAQELYAYYHEGE